MDVRLRLLLPLIMTLLNRAEAYVLSKQYDKAVNDLQYWYRIKAATKVPDKDELNLFYEISRSYD